MRRGTVPKLRVCGTEPAPLRGIALVGRNGVHAAQHFGGLAPTGDDLVNDIR